MAVPMRPIYTATAVRNGRWWALEVPEIGGVCAQARRLDQAAPMVREAIALALDVSEDTFDVLIEPQMQSLGRIAGVVEDALRARHAAEAAQDASSAAMRHAVRELRSSGYTARDAGTLLAVSNQRISQLERSQGKRPARTP